MDDPGHLALGTWSGGRFMHFGEPLDDEKEFERTMKKAKNLDEMFANLRKLKV